MKHGKKKLFLSLLLILILAFSAVACGSDDDNGGGGGGGGGEGGEGSGGEPEIFGVGVRASDVLASYVASLSSYVASDYMVRGQQVTLLYDGTVKIYCSFWHPMMGSGNAVYQGEYTLTEAAGGAQTLNAAYKLTPADTEERSFTAQIQNGRFRASIYHLRGLVDDESEDSVKGLTFYETAAPEIDETPDGLYLGALAQDSAVYAYILTYKGAEFDLFFNHGGVIGKLSGAAEFIAGTLTTSDILRLTYDVKEISGGVLTDGTVTGGAGKITEIDTTRSPATM
jgi:hypothetical protein